MKLAQQSLLKETVLCVRSISRGKINSLKKGEWFVITGRCFLSITFGDSLGGKSDVSRSQS